MHPVSTLAWLDLEPGNQRICIVSSSPRRFGFLMDYGAAGMNPAGSPIGARSYRDGF
jgi:hypothetical protein